jgi:hypothetical protein
MYMICMNKVACSELGERVVLFRKLTKDDMMSTNTLSAYLVMICSLLDRSRWTYGLRQWFPTSGRDPKQARVECNVRLQEGLMENSIIMNKNQNFYRNSKRIFDKTLLLNRCLLILKF